jgi:ATP-dependent Zn protease
MKPDIWGKHFWYTIHFIALDYPEKPSNEDKRDFQFFFENLHKVIPCYKCSVNYVKHLKERPLTSSDLENNETLFRWTVDIHNIVNRDLKKRQVSYDDAWRIYQNFGDSKKKNTWLLFLVFILLFIILFMIIAYFWSSLRLSKR